MHVILATHDTNNGKCKSWTNGCTARLHIRSRRYDTKFNSHMNNIIYLFFINCYDYFNYVRPRTIKNLEIVETNIDIYIILKKLYFDNIILNIERCMHTIHIYFDRLAVIYTRLLDYNNNWLWSNRSFYAIQRTPFKTQRWDSFF